MHSVKHENGDCQINVSKFLLNKESLTCNLRLKSLFGSDFLFICVEGLL